MHECKPLGVGGPGVGGTVTTIACPPGLTGLLCLRCLPGTYKVGCLPLSKPN